MPQVEKNEKETVESHHGDEVLKQLIWLPLNRN